jgi:hypothetical protein
MIAIDVSVVHPLAESNSSATAQANSFLHSNAATEPMEKHKKQIYESLRANRGMEFVPIHRLHHHRRHRTRVPALVVGPVLEIRRGATPPGRRRPVEVQIRTTNVA